MAAASLPVRPTGDRRARRRFRHGWATGYLLVAPFFVLFTAFGAYPLVYSFELSLTDWHGAGAIHWVGFANYSYLLHDGDFWRSLANSGVMWLLVVPVQTIGGIAAAVLLSRSRLRFTRVLRTVVILPYVTPLAAMAQAFILIFDRDFGVANWALTHLGLGPVGWLTSTAWSKPTIALFVVWKTSGFALIIFLAAVQSIPQEIYEAARIDGAGAFRAFTSITVPLLTGAISFFIVVATLGSSQMFLEPYILTRGGPYNSSQTSGLYLYQHIGSSDLGTGAANSFLLVLLVLVLSLGSVRLLRQRGAQ